MNADEEARALLFRVNERLRCAGREARATSLAGSAAAATADRERWAPFFQADEPVACEDDEEEPHRLRSLSP